jgi:hypothetical protein
MGVKTCLQSLGTGIHFPGIFTDLLVNIFSLCFGFRITGGFRGGAAGGRGGFAPRGGAGTPRIDYHIAVNIYVLLFRIQFYVFAHAYMCLKIICHLQCIVSHVVRRLPRRCWRRSRRRLLSRRRAGWILMRGYSVCACEKINIESISLKVWARLFCRGKNCQQFELATVAATTKPKKNLVRVGPSGCAACI